MMQTIETFLNDLKATPIGQAILSKQAATARAARQTIVDRRTTLQAELSEAMTKHEKLVKPLSSTFEAARHKADEAGRALLEAQRKRSIDVRALESAIAEADRELIANADPRIDEALWAMRDRFESSGHSLATHREIEVGRNVMTGRPVFRVETNRGGIERLSAAMLAARDAFDALKLENPEDLDAAIAGILVPVEAAWQTIGEFAPLPL